MYDFEEECLTLFYAMVCLMLSQQKQIDNTYLDLDYYGYHKKPSNNIIV